MQLALGRQCWCCACCAATAIHPMHVPTQAAYKVLPKQELLKRQAQAVGEVTNVLGIPDEEACRVLRKYKW